MFSKDTKLRLIHALADARAADEIEKKVGKSGKVSDADEVGYDGETSGLAAEDVQAAIDELVASLGALDVGANAALSNLEPTAINQDLLPDGSLNIGAQFNKWDVVHANTFGSMPGQTLLTGQRVDIECGAGPGSGLFISSGNAQLVVSGSGFRLNSVNLNADNNTVSNLREPQVDSEAATKGYVDTAIEDTANKSLSNLEPTAINQDLLPDGSRNLGAIINRWSNIYADSFGSPAGQTTLIGNSITIQSPDGLVIDSGPFSAQFVGSGFTFQSANPVRFQRGLLTENDQAIRAELVSGTQINLLNLDDGDTAVLGDAQATGLDIRTARIRRGTSTEFYEEVYIDDLTLLANTTAVASELTFAHAEFEVVRVEYKIKEDGTQNVQAGTLLVATNGTDLQIEDLVEINTDVSGVDVTWAAAINGADVELSYTTTNANEKTMRAMVKKIRA